jgi:hypothetical protein
MTNTRTTVDRSLQVVKRDKIVTNYKGFMISGWNGIYKLGGDPEILQFAYGVDIGDIPKDLAYLSLCRKRRWLALICRRSPVMPKPRGIDDKLKIKENRRMKEINRENGMFLHILMYWEM